MIPIIPFIVGGVIGWFISEENKSSKVSSDVSGLDDTKYSVIANSESWSDIKLDFDNYDDAKKMYDKIVNSKKIQWKDIDKYDEYLKIGRALKENVDEENTNPNETSDVYEVSLVVFTDKKVSDIVLENKEF